MEPILLGICITLGIVLLLACFASAMSLYIFLTFSTPPRPVTMKTAFSADRQNVTYGANPDKDVFVASQRVKNNTTINGHYFTTGTLFTVIDQLHGSKSFEVTDTGVKPMTNVPAQTQLIIRHPLVQCSEINEESLRSVFPNRAMYDNVCFPGAYGLDILGTLSGVSNNILNKIGLLNLPEIDVAQFNAATPALVKDSSYAEILFGTLQYFNPSPKYFLHDFIYATYRPSFMYNKDTTPSVTAVFPMGTIFESYYQFSIDNTDMMTVSARQGQLNGDVYTLRGISKTTNLIKKTFTNYVVLSSGKTLIAEVVVGFDGTHITLDASGKPVVSVTVSAPDPVADLGAEAAGFTCFYCVRPHAILVSGFPTV